MTAIWVNDPARGAARAGAFKSFADGMFTLASMPCETTTRDQADVIRRAGLGVNGHYNGTGSPAFDGSNIITQRGRIGANLIDIDAEVSDDKLGAYMRDVIMAIRQVGGGRLPFPVRLAIAPRKSGFLPIDLFSDTNLYAAIFTYYGNMQGRYSEAQALAELLHVGVPLTRAGVIYAAACDTWVPGLGTWRRTLTMPSVFEASGTTTPTVHPTDTANIVGTLALGPVYNDDLMADMGCWQ